MRRKSDGGPAALWSMCVKIPAPSMGALQRPSLSGPAFLAQVTAEPFRTLFASCSPCPLFKDDLVATCQAAPPCKTWPMLLEAGGTSSAHSPAPDCEEQMEGRGRGGQGKKKGAAFFHLAVLPAACSILKNSHFPKRDGNKNAEAH